jgi:hypothetical protein
MVLLVSALLSVAFAGIGTTSEFNGYLKGIITGVSTMPLEIQIVQLMLKLYLE